MKYDYLLNFEDDLDRLLEHQYESTPPYISIELLVLICSFYMRQVSI